MRDRIKTMKKNNHINIILLLFVLLNLTSQYTYAQSIDIEVTIPKLNVGTYHRPYVAIWLETDRRKGVHTLAVWHEKDDWLKDMRQWWRKLGRKDFTENDATSSATRKPDTYQINWNGLDKKGKKIPPGEYYLSFEAAREAGGRDYIRQKITLGNNTPQHYSLKGDIELGNINIRIN